MKLEVLDSVIDGITASDANKIIKMLVEGMCGAKYSNLFSDKGKTWLRSLPNALDIEIRPDQDLKKKIDQRDDLGDILFETFFAKESALLSPFLNKLQKKVLDLAQFNELLLLLDQDRIDRGFYQYFFAPERKNSKSALEEGCLPDLSISELKEGIKRFMAIAMLCFGNIRYAYKDLRTRTWNEIDKRIKRISSLPVVNSDSCNMPRPRNRVLEIDKIDRHKTWYIGYLSARILKNEKGQLKSGDSDQLTFYNSKEEELKETIRKAEKNTEAYLSWDYMDVYVATSMRQRWEYEDTYDFVESLFKIKDLAQLHLRYFDPTQSSTGDRRIDKGLVEGLMLKRAICTIYLAQETDTMGKDSELAATLAQGKPVIAYVPEIDVSSFKKTIESRPLEYFKIRYRLLHAEGIFENVDFIKYFKDEYTDGGDAGEIIGNFVNEIIVHRKTYPLSIWHEEKSQKDQEFKDSTSRNFKKICEAIALAEKFYFDKRYTTLAQIHPLSLQVHLDTGVSNGVLVVRNINQCAQLLRSIVMGEMTFKIEHDQKERVIVLKEAISQCPFRAVTEYEPLTNSFWNYYL